MLQFHTMRRLSKPVRSRLTFRAVLEAYLLECQMPAGDINLFFHSFPEEELANFSQRLEGQDKLLYECIQDVFEKALVWLTFRKCNTQVPMYIKNTLETLRGTPHFSFSSYTRG